jgi:pyridoxamine 5'-phosphate oxidase
MDGRDLDPDPLRQFQLWFAEAHDAGLEAPEAVVLATASPEGRPSARMVLLKGADESGFELHTNYESRKGAELQANPYAALLFHWQPLGRQVRIEGSVTRLPAEESDAYFRQRPRASQLAAWASPQSRPLDGDDALAALFADAAARFFESDVPRPPHWGGLRLHPDAYEFWQHAADRLHDRIRYRRDGASWARERLAP